MCGVPECAGSAEVGKRYIIRDRWISGASANLPILKKMKTLQELFMLSIIDRQERTMKVSSTEFQQNVGRYQDAALQAPIAITKNGRAHTVLMSASFFELVMKGRVSRSVGELDYDTLKAIAGSAVSSEFAALDSIVDDWTP
jgi:hypothetical protein